MGGGGGLGKKNCFLYVGPLLLLFSPYEARGLFTMWASWGAFFRLAPPVKFSACAHVIAYYYQTI